MRINGHFDELQFWDTAYFGYHRYEADNSLIFVRYIEVFPGHPLNNTNGRIMLQEASLVFEGVTSLERVIDEYLRQPTQGRSFKDVHIVRNEINNSANTTDKITNTYLLEGVLGESFSLIVPKTLASGIIINEQ